MQKYLFLGLLIFSLFSTSCSSQKSTSEPEVHSNNNESAEVVDKGKNGIYNMTDYKVGKTYEDAAYVTFAGGCFWCVEGAFQQIDGIIDVVSGYSGGNTTYPTYRQVGSGGTGHAEAIQIFYDAEKLDYQVLLDIFFEAHDPTQANGQGPDIGAAYRAIIFYDNDTQKDQATAYIKALTNTGVYSKPIVTQLAPFESFWVAEAYHQDYYKNHPENPYVQSVSKPKVEKIRRVFKDRLKKN